MLEFASNNAATHVNDGHLDSSKKLKFTLQRFEWCEQQLLAHENSNRSRLKGKNIWTLCFMHNSSTGHSWYFFRRKILVLYCKFCCIKFCFKFDSFLPLFNKKLGRHSACCIYKNDLTYTRLTWSNLHHWSNSSLQKDNLSIVF